MSELLLALALSLSAIAAAAAEDLPVIAPAEAPANLDRHVLVEFRVLSAHWMDDKDVCFLNSERDNRQRNNFTVFIAPQGMRAYRDQCQIENPAAHFIDRQIRVQGQIQSYRGKPEMRVESPTQIHLLPAKASTPSDQRKTQAPESAASS